MKAQAALALAALLALSGCTLPGGSPSGPSYEVTADFGDVLDLVPQAAVKVNDVTVGSVERISLGGASERSSEASDAAGVPVWTARVRMRVGRDVRLPANATAAIRQSSLLGEKFVSLAAPTTEDPQGTLGPGAVIPLARTTRSAEMEEVLAAFGLLLNGGGLAQLKTIETELSTALRGRESTVEDLLHQLDTFLAGLDAQRADILRTIDALDRFSAHLAQERGTLRSALDALGPGLTVLAQQREQLTQALTALSNLSTVGTRVVNASRDDTLSVLASLRPLLDQLVRAGNNLPKALDFLLTYPFPPNVTGAIHSDFVSMHLTVDLDGAAILSNLLATPAGTSATPGTPGKPASPAKPAKPTVPTVPGLPPLLPGGSPSVSPSPGTAAPPPGCSLLDILTGKCLLP
jgi:phospholipid/cholesterol/gamma-HCH transport system substrate-binding protein